MFKKLLVNCLYIKVYKNEFKVKNVSEKSEWVTLKSGASFTTNRLLVGNFSVAEPLLTNAIKSLLPKFYLISPMIVIQPMEMVEGGLSEVEERIFNELALATRAHKVVVHIGAELSDQDVISSFKSNKRH